MQSYNLKEYAPLFDVDHILVGGNGLFGIFPIDGDWHCEADSTSTYRFQIKSSLYKMQKQFFELIS